MRSNSIVFHRRSSFVRTWLSLEAGRPSFWAGRLIGMIGVIRFAALLPVVQGFADAGFVGRATAGSLNQIFLSPSNLLGLCWVGLAASLGVLVGVGARWAAGIIAIVIWAQMRILGVYGNLTSDLLIFESALVMWMVGAEGAGARWSFWKRMIYYLFLARVFWFIWPAALAVFVPYFWMSFGAAIIGGRWFRRAHLCFLAALPVMILTAGGDPIFGLACFALIFLGWESGPKNQFKEEDPLGFARHSLLAQGWVALKAFSFILSLGYAAVGVEWMGNHLAPSPKPVFPKAMIHAVARFVPVRFWGGYPPPSRSTDWRIQIEVSADGQKWSPLTIRMPRLLQTELTDRLGSYIKGIRQIGPSETAVLSRLAVRYFIADSPVRGIFASPDLNPLYFRYAVYQEDPQTQKFTRFAGTALFPIHYDPQTRRADWVIR